MQWKALFQTFPDALDRAAEDGWQFDITPFDVTLPDGTKAHRVMRRRIGSRLVLGFLRLPAWEYRAPTPDEDAAAEDRDAW